MKTLRNLFLVIALSTSFAMADGHTGNGNRCTEPCLTAEPPASTTETTNEEEVPVFTAVEFWSELFFELIGY